MKHRQSWFKIGKRILCRHKYMIFMESVKIQSENICGAKCGECGKIIDNIKLFTLAGHDAMELNQICKKRCYPNKKSAETVLNYVRGQKRKKMAQRIYRCEKCKGWHITSKNSYGIHN